VLQLSFFCRSQLPFNNKAHFDVPDVMLHELVLRHGRHLSEGVKANKGPMPRAVGHSHEIPFAPENSSECRQPAATGAWPTRFRVVADVIAHKRRGKIMQISDDDSPDLAARAGRAFIVYNLDDEVFSHDVIESAQRALNGDDAHFV